MTTISHVTRAHKWYGWPVVATLVAVLLLGARNSPAGATGLSASSVPVTPSAERLPRSAGETIATLGQEQACEEMMAWWLLSREAWLWVLCFDEGESCEARIAQQRPLWEASVWTICFDPDAASP